MKGRFTGLEGWNRWDDRCPDVDEAVSVIVATNKENTGEAYLEEGFWHWANGNRIIWEEVLFWRDFPDAPVWEEIPELEEDERGMCA